MRHASIHSRFARSAGLLVFAILFGGSGALFATNDDARSFAIEAAIPWLDQEEDPYSLRETWWAQDSKTGEAKLIRHQLFARNDYRFWVACNELEAKVSIHIYNESGKLVDTEAFAKAHTAGVRFVPEKTGIYFLRIVVESSPTDPTHWAVVYGYR
ncbi:MAG: T9SS type A sorting domain-containing protein [Verrucomicrobiota bacterium]